MCVLLASTLLSLLPTVVCLVVQRVATTLHLLVYTTPGSLLGVCTNDGFVIMGRFLAFS